MVDGFFDLAPVILARLRDELSGHCDTIASDAELDYLPDLGANGSGVYLLPAGGNPAGFGGRGKQKETQEWTLAVVVPAPAADAYPRLGGLAIRVVRALHYWAPEQAGPAGIRLTARSAVARAPTWLEVDLTFTAEVVFDLSENAA